MRSPLKTRRRDVPFAPAKGWTCEIRGCHNPATQTAQLRDDPHAVALCDDHLDNLRAHVRERGGNPDELDVLPIG